MHRCLLIIIYLSAAIGGCRQAPDERVRLVPQVSPVEPKRAAFSPVEPNRLLIMEASGQIGIWDIADDTPQLYASIPAGAIDAVFAPDGRSVLTIGIDGRVHSWTMDGQLQWLSQGGHGVPGRALAVSADLIASGGEDGAIRLWKRDGTSLGEIANAHEKPVMSLAISPEGNLASLGGDEVMRLWKRAEAPPGQPPIYTPVVLFQPQVRRYPHGFMQLVWHDVSWGWDRSVAFSPDGKAIAGVLFDGSLRLWNADGTPRVTVAAAHRDRQVRALTFDPAGDLLATAGFDGTVRLWNLDGSPHGKPLETHFNSVFSVTFAQDGRRFATTGLDNLVQVWKIDGSPLLTFPRGHEDRVITVAVAPEKSIIAVAERSGSLRLWSLDGSSLAPPLTGHAGPAQTLAFSPRHDALVSAGADGTLRTWDLDGPPRAAPIVFTRPGAFYVNPRIRFSPNGERLAVGSSYFQMWNDKHLLWEAPLRSADTVSSIAFSPQPDFIVTGSMLGDIEVWNQDGSVRTPPLKQKRENISSVAVAPDATYFAAVVGGSSSAITLFELNGSPRGAPLEVTFGAIKTLTFTPSGKLVSGGEDGVVRLWTLPARTVESVDVGASINQLGFWHDLMWVRAGGESVFFYEPGGILVATMLLRRDSTLIFTPDGWFSGSDGSGKFIRAYGPSGEPLGKQETASRFSPEKVLARLEQAADSKTRW